MRVAMSAEHAFAANLVDGAWAAVPGWFRALTAEPVLVAFMSHSGGNR